MGTLFLPPRRVLLGTLLALAVIIGAVIPAWKAEAIFWSYQHFDRQIPAAMAAVLEVALKDELAAAELAFPDFDTQILTSEANATEWANNPEPDHLMVLVGGNPNFCNAEGCTLYNFERDAEGEWNQVWLVPSNGFFIGTDLFYYLIETRHGCQHMQADSTTPEYVVPLSCSILNVSPYDYGGISEEEMKEEREQALGHFAALKKFVLSSGIKAEIRDPKNYTSGFRIKNADIDARVDQLKAFCAERGLTCASWGGVPDRRSGEKIDGIFLVILFPRIKEHFYHDSVDYRVNWVTE